MESTELTLSSSNNPSIVGDAVVFTAEVLALGLVPVLPGFEVAFYHGSDFLGSDTTDDLGQASITVSNLPTGSSEIYALFLGGPFGFFDSFSSSGDFLTQSVQTATSPPPVAPQSPPPPSLQQRFVAGGDSLARTVRADGTIDREFLLFDSGFLGGVRVGVGDVTRDGIPEVFLASGPGGPPLVRAFDGATGNLLWERYVFEESFLGGVYIAVGDLTGDDVPELVVSPDEGGGPVVKVLSGTDGGELTAFYGIDDPNFRGGARIALGDINGDKRLDILVSAGYLGGPRATVFDGSLVVVPGQTEPPPKLVDDFFAFEESLRNGSYVAFGDVNGDGYADMIFGGGPGGGPRVLVVDGLLAMAHGAGDPMAISLFNFFAGNENQRDGVLVSCTDLNGDGVPDIIASASGGVVKAYDGRTGADLFVPEILVNYGGYAVTGLLPEATGGSEGVKTKQFAGPLVPPPSGSESGSGNTNQDNVISSLIGTYKGSKTMNYVDVSPNQGSSGNVSIALVISDAYKSGDHYIISGRIRVSIAGEQTLDESFTGQYNPSDSTISYDADHGGTYAKSGIGATWDNSVIRDPRFDAQIGGEWYLIPAPITLNRV